AKEEQAAVRQVPSPPRQSAPAVAKQDLQAERDLADATKALAANAKDVTALQNLRRNEEALAAYDAALRLAPAHANARNNRGNVNRALKHYEAALQDF